AGKEDWPPSSQTPDVLVLVRPPLGWLLPMFPLGHCQAARRRLDPDVHLQCAERVGSAFCFAQTAGSASEGMPKRSQHTQKSDFSCLYFLFLASGPRPDRCGTPLRGLTTGRYPPRRDQGAATGGVLPPSPVPAGGPDSSFLPFFANVTNLEWAQLEPSRARQPNTVTVSPGSMVSVFFQPTRLSTTGG